MSLVTATNEPFVPSGTSGQLSVAGVPLVSGAVVTSMKRNDWQGNLTLSASSRTNVIKQSILPGALAAPTGWSQGVGTGTSAPVASSFGNADGAQAYSQTATAARPWIYQTVTVSANTTYCVSLVVESVSASIQALEVLVPSTLPAGASISYPICSANPSGGSTGIVQAGVLVVVLTVVATAGTFISRTGLGCSNPITGSIQFSRPQCEIGTSRGSFIPTTAAAASVTDYAVADSGAVTLGQTASGTYAWSGSGQVADTAAPPILDQTQYGMGGSYGPGRNYASVPVQDDEWTKDGFLRDKPLVIEQPKPIPPTPLPVVSAPKGAIKPEWVSTIEPSKALVEATKPIQAPASNGQEALKTRNNHALRLLLLAS